MDVHIQSRSGPLVSSLSEISSRVSREISSRQQEWLVQLRADPKQLAQLEHKVHEAFQRLADQVVAGLLAEASTQSPALDAAQKK